MDTPKPSDSTIHIAIFVVLGFLTVGFLFLFNEIENVKKIKVTEKNQQIVYQTPVPTTEPQVTAMPSSSPKIVYITSKPEKRITYIDLSANVTTQNTDWTDISSTDVLINLDEEYGTNAYVDWEATVNTISTGSKVFVRLYDATHNIGVDGSELETNSVTTTRVASKRIYFWKGHNTYRVQIKSLNGVDATYSGGRIKIVY